MNSSYNELANEVDLYRSLFQLISIHPTVNGWYNWKLGEKWKERQIFISPTGTQEKPLKPKELAVIAIALSEWNEKSELERLYSQWKIMDAGIITVDDIVKTTQHLLMITRREHITSRKFLTNATENTAKITMLVWAYNKIAKHLIENHDDINDPEYMILLGYVIAILGYRFEFRPYMINHNLIDTNWVGIYDSMFSGFDENSKYQYIDKWYYSLWEMFRSIRNEIETKILIKKTKQDLLVSSPITPELVSWLLANIFTPQSPSASTHPQGRLFP